MKFRQEQQGIPESEELALISAIRTLEHEQGENTPAAGMPDAYWQNLIVRTNRRVDEATSGKAISISWAARVAIPGVVAILSFLIALHYYVPGPVGSRSDVASVVLALPDHAVDSLLADAALSEESLTAIAANENLFDVPSEQIGEYFIENGNASTVVELLPDEQVDRMLEHLARTK